MTTDPLKSSDSSADIVTSAEGMAAPIEGVIAPIEAAGSPAPAAGVPGELPNGTSDQGFGSDAASDSAKVDDAHPFLALLKLAVPTVVTMSSFTVMQFVDKLMVSRVSADPIYVGAHGNGGLISFVPISIAMGLVTVVNSFVSQNLGAGKANRAPAYAWNAIWLSIAYWAAIIVPLALALPLIFGAMRSGVTDQNELAELLRRDTLSIGYARILMLGAFLTLSTRAVSQFFFGMHKPYVVLVAGLAGNLTNCICNSIFIYGPQQAPHTGYSFLDGWFAFTAKIASTIGVPRMELNGAAWGTIVGTLVELSIPLAVFLSPTFHRLYQTRSTWQPSLSHFKDLLKVGWGPALMFGNEMICWGMFMVYMVGHYGPDHSSAAWIAHQYMALSFMPAVGLSVAVTAMVGKCMGAKRPDLAAARTWTGVATATVYMLICAACFIAFREPMIRLFLSDDLAPDRAEKVVAMGSTFLLLVSGFQLFDAFAMTIVGALRGAGDTAWPGIMTLICSWSIIVGGGTLIMHFFPRLESTGPWIAASSYIVVLGTLMLLRFLSGKWKTRSLVKDDGVAGH